MRVLLTATTFLLLQVYADAYQEEPSPLQHLDLVRLYTPSFWDYVANGEVGDQSQDDEVWSSKYDLMAKARSGRMGSEYQEVVSYFVEDGDVEWDDEDSVVETVMVDENGDEYYEDDHGWDAEWEDETDGESAYDAFDNDHNSQNDYSSQTESKSQIMSGYQKTSGSGISNASQNKYNPEINHDSEVANPQSGSGISNASQNKYNPKINHDSQVASPQSGSGISNASQNKYNPKINHDSEVANPQIEYDPKDFYKFEPGHITILVPKNKQNPKIHYNPKKYYKFNVESTVLVPKASVAKKPKPSPTPKYKPNNRPQLSKPKPQAIKPKYKAKQTRM